eukprot:SAG11_NODE_7528_length_1134_cov_1.492754_1_plen_113_part_10
MLCHSCPQSANVHADTGTSNYFTILVWDGFGVSGVFGEGCASSSRHMIVLTLTAWYIFGYSKNTRRFGAGSLRPMPRTIWQLLYILVASPRADIYGAKPSRAEWRRFLVDGAA